MKLKNAKKSFATMFMEAEGNIFHNLLLKNIKIVESKKNKKKQRIYLTVKTEWQAAPSSKLANRPSIPEPQPEMLETPTPNPQINPATPSPETAADDTETQKLTAEINKLQREIHALKSENQSLSSELCAMQHELEKHQKNLARKEEIITEVRREMYEMKQAAQKHNHMPQYAADKPQQAVLLKFGQEVDLYENEILSFTRKALDYALNNHTHDKSRYRHILTDLLQANPLERDVRADKKNELHKIMRTYTRMDNPTYQALCKFGFTITEQGAHYKLVFMNDGRYTYSAAKTSSDRGSGQNWVRDVGNVLF